MSYIIMFLFTLPLRQTLLIDYFELFTFKEVLKAIRLERELLRFILKLEKIFSINKNVYRFIPIISSLW
jgi:hypothetical protein